MNAALRVERWTLTSRLFTGGSVVVAAGLAFVPLVFDPDVTQKLTVLLILVLLAAMWNALAGYGGLVSVGQQAFIGIGAYATIFLAGYGVPPYLAMIAATAFVAGVAVPISIFAVRFRGAEFAIGMWVTAEVFRILVTLAPSLGGGTGASLIQLNQYDPIYQQAFTYWTALGFAVLFMAVLFMLLRRPFGLSLQAVRDNEGAANSLGVRVRWSKRVLFVVAAAGCGAAGTALLANTHFVQPDSIFSVQWTALMIFMVLVGGIGTFEGPIVGAILLWAIQTVFSAGGAWYLIGLGAAAAGFAIFFPGGLWGFVEGRFGIRLLPVGYFISGTPEAVR